MKEFSFKFPKNNVLHYKTDSKKGYSLSCFKFPKNNVLPGNMTVEGNVVTLFQIS